MKIVDITAFKVVITQSFTNPLFIRKRLAAVAPAQSGKINSAGIGQPPSQNISQAVVKSFGRLKKTHDA